MPKKNLLELVAKYSTDDINVDSLKLGQNPSHLVFPQCHALFDNTLITTFRLINLTRVPLLPFFQTWSVFKLCLDLYSG
eukprot:m.225739 g.225739  ORF g.225739 m.225739 type:complete len:79 (+) comp40018_c0_seq1:829-1065(+)